MPKNTDNLKIDLSGKIILVTGASRGIGEAITHSLAATGATIAVHANSNIEAARKIAQSSGNNSHPFQCDLSDFSEAKMLIKQVINFYGHLDVVINNAGIAFNSPPDKNLDDWINKWNETIAVNLTSTGIICREALNFFEGSKTEGIIINVSSRAAFRGDTKEYLAYAASKGGVEAITKSIARGYGKNDITCFGIAPGFTQTDMAQKFIDEYGEEYVLNDIALNSLTEPKDIAPLVTFLCSGMAKHATGTTFHVNAGSYMH